MKNSMPGDIPDFVKNFKPISDEKIQECLKLGMAFRKQIEEATKGTVKIGIVIKKGL